MLQSLQVGLVGLLSVWITHKLGRLSRRGRRVENRIGNYEIIKEVGAGGMGKVYLTKHLYMGRLAAIKVLEAKTENLKSSRERFEQEVKLSAKLTHPNTIILYDFGTTSEGKSYYAMEWLEGLDLKRLVEQYGPLSPARAIYILTQVCASLGESHSQGVIHRDINPGNIFITHRGGIFDFVKVLDFGLAKKVVSVRDPELTQEGLSLGTPLFVAPEIIFDKNKLDCRTDIYLLGCCAYWILTGHAPFNAKNDEELILAHANFQPDPISKWRQDLPSRLEEVIFRCLEKLSQDRYQSVEEFSEALLSLSMENSWSPEEAQEWWQNNIQPAEATYWEMIPVDESNAGSSETGSVFPIG